MSMHLYLIRHAEAVSQEEAGLDHDEDRPLTPAGQAQCRVVARALRQLGARMDKVLTSPLVRARQTAEGVLQHWGNGAPALEESAYLAPGGKKRKLLRELLAAGAEGIGLVGHNPDLSELVGWMIGEKEVGVEMAKAGVACIEFESAPCKGTGILAWLAPPALLEAIAGK
jgi:phosphohistidine phosphatase